MRSQAMSKYRGSFSIPMNFRHVLMQAIPVVAEPMKGSRTVCPGWVKSATSSRISGIGFSVGCAPWRLTFNYQGEATAAGTTLEFNIHFLHSPIR